MADKSLKELRIERGGLKRILTNLEKKIAQTPALDEITARGIREQLDKLLEKFFPIQSKIEYLVFEDAGMQITEEGEGDSFHKRVSELQIELLRFAKTVTPAPEPANKGNAVGGEDLQSVLKKQTELMDKLVEVQNSKGNGTRTKLPDLTIPKFSGEYMDWPYFRDVFESTIHNNSRLAAIEKMRYLTTSLEGCAVDDVKNILLSNDNYEPTWQRVKNRYDKPVHLVNAYIQQFMAQSQKKVNTASELLEASRKYRQVIDGLTAMDHEGMTLDVWLIYLMKLNMHDKFRTKWEEGRTADQLSSLDEFFEFMTEVTDVMERANVNLTPSQDQKQVAKQQQTKSKFKTHHTNSVKCPECDGAHELHLCDKFKDLSLFEKRDRVSQQRLCFNCLKSNHAAARCSSRIKCQKCGRRHHTLLHSPGMGHGPEEAARPVQNSAMQQQVPGVQPANRGQQQTRTESQSQPTPEPQASTSSGITTHHSAVHHKALLPTAVVYVRDFHGNNLPCRVLIDGGGECTMISEDCAQRLALPRTRARIAVQGAGEVNVGYTKGLISMELCSRFDQRNKIKVEAYVMEKVTSMLPSRDISESRWSHISCLQLADTNYRVPGKIDIILGAEYAFAINLPQILRGEAHEPIAQLTIFGWIVGGRTDSPLTSITSLHTKCNLDDLLKRFWEVEHSNLDQRHLLTEEEKMCEDHFTQTHTRDDTGRYVVRLPFKKEHEQLGNSSSTALARFQSLERRFKRDQSLHEQYREFMGEYLSLNHMEPVLDREHKSEGQSYFLPHQAVMRPSSETTKLRVVFDASTTTRPRNPSLNDILAIGPTRQDDLLVLLLRFRTHKVAMTADVEKMYRQIEVASEDRDFQRIFWRDDFRDELQVFRLTTVTYGTSSAPFLAVRVLHQIALDYKDQFPEACEAISTSFYMDDLLCGAETSEDGKRLQKEIQEVLNKGHFTLRKWTSNSCEVLEEIPPQLRAINPDDVTSESKAISALGLVWTPGRDELALAIDSLPLVTNKRELCGASAKIYDPLGFVAPVVIKLKIMFQNLWLTKLNWDDVLPEEIVTAYNKIQSEFHLIQNVRIPRIIPSQNNIIELHGFADASERAYGAVLYAKGIDREGNIEVNIVIAKSRVAPLKPITIPRLELNAAVLLSELITKFRESLGNKTIAIHAWSDSTVVLQWLQESPRTWNTFVAHRVAAIQESVPPIHWRHVGTTDNPADCISRGISPAELANHRLWFHGPPWLRDSEEHWPKDRVIRTKATQERTSHAISLVTQKEEEDPLTHLIETTSGYLKIIRFVAYWRRYFRNRAAKDEDRQKGFLTTREMEDALTCILRHIQRKTFPVEYKCCLKGERLPKSSKLLKLVPFLDKNGVMRVQGRLAHAGINYATQHPIILASNVKFVRDLMIFNHEMNLHAGAAILMNTLRTKYWILGLRNLAKGITRRCVKCIKAKPTMETPFMGDLPAARVQQHRAFYLSGCDFAGPIKIRASKMRKAPVIKAYIAVFICMTTKAMHLEAVSDLSTDAFIAALRRFTARRGHCHTIYCDNGTNFQGASGISRAERLKGIRTHQHKVTSEMSGIGTQFNFIPSYSPTFGGLWERGVSSVKTHLRRVLGESLLTFEELSTVLAQIEACLNSRPLCAKTTDIDDIDPLTPGHFLVGHPLNLTPGPDLLDTNPNRLDQWYQLQRMVQHFWKRWHQEYVTTLQHRSKWYTKKRNITVGDLVLIRDNALKPTFWRMGRVLDVHPGKDNVVRVATVKTQDGVQRRAVNTLAWLPTDGLLSPSRTQEGENVGF